MKKFLFTILISFISILFINIDDVSALSGTDPVYVSYYLEGDVDYTPVGGIQFRVYAGDACGTGTVIYPENYLQTYTNATSTTGVKTQVTIFNQIPAEASNTICVMTDDKTIPEGYEIESGPNGPLTFYSKNVSTLASYGIRIKLVSTAVKEKGSIEICTEDTETKDGVSGVKLSLRLGSNGSVISTKTVTNKCVVFDDLEQSTDKYYVKVEDYDKDEYTIVGETEKDFIINENHTQGKLNDEYTYGFVPKSTSSDDDEELGSIKVCTENEDGDIVEAKVTLTSPVDDETTSKNITTKCVTFNNLETSGSYYKVTISNWDTAYKLIGDETKQTKVLSSNLDRELTFEFEEANTAVTTGTIKVNFKDEDKKTLTGVKYKLCKDKACNDVINSQSLGNHAGLRLGTYYVSITEVPKGYVLPKEPYEVTLTSEHSTDTLTITVSSQTKVPDTLMNASKVFTLCGIVGMLAGISLLYFNAKKKEEV